MPSIAFTDMLCQDSSDDSIRRLTDDYGRHRLTDLMEADESEEDGLDYLKSARRNRYTSIGSTASSMDGLWELHPRRLSEAGLSRHSDSSAVLTEDTDSFIIGQRVWVGGTKPGTIAYIGETQFAPGDWAGIALDEPIGKNDGSVGGIRYFQCESKKGVFSRLTRLTRVPLEQPGMGSNETFISPNNGVRKSPISPTGSTRSLLKSAASLSNSNTSLNSAATHVDFKIGDRVIIKSTQGSKIGTVRFMGLTDFAPGEWVGVELDDPRGKNDGSVEGKRYFECRPNFGLFAPISKVSKSPSKHKPSACVVHSGPGLPPSGLKRASSKESMTSMTSRTSVASSVRRVRLGVTSLTPKKISPKTTSTPLPTRTALQDVLREKQQHIEQLLKERDLERAEITRAASQADEAEQKFFTLKQEFEQYRAECEAKVRESSDILAELKIDQGKLLSQLEDEKRRNEDLEFKFEEAAITKNDIEAINENHAKKIEYLEKRLAEEHQKTEALESTSNKLFEAEENLIKSREEVEFLKSELEKTRRKNAATEEEKFLTAQFIESLQKQVQGVAIENEEKNSIIRQLYEQIAEIKSQHEIAKRDIQESQKKSEENCEEKDKIIEKLRSELANQTGIIEEYEKTKAELAKENEKLKMELSAKSHDVETANDEIAAKEKEIKSIQQELETVKKQIGEKGDDLERHKDNSTKVEETLKTELAQTREDLKTKISEVENVKKEYNVQISQKDQELEDKNSTITQHSAEIKKLSEELSGVKAKFVENEKDIHDRHSRQVELHDSQLAVLTTEIKEKNEELAKYTAVVMKLEKEICDKGSLIEKLQDQIKEVENQESSKYETLSLMTKQLNECSLRNGDVERQLEAANRQIAELTNMNQQLQADIQSFTINNGQNASQVAELRLELQQKQEQLLSLRTEFEQKLQVSEKNRHEIELRNEAAVAEFERTRTELEKKLQLSIESLSSLQASCNSSNAETNRAREEYTQKITQLQQLIQEKEADLTGLNDKINEREKYFEERLKTVTDELNRNVHLAEQKVLTFTEETTKLKQQLSEKTEQLIVAQSEISHTSAQGQQKEKELQQKYGDEIRQWEFDFNEKKIQLEKTLTELQLVKQECHNIKPNVEVANQKISELTVELQQANNVTVQLQDQLNNAQTSCQQSQNELEMIKHKNQELLEQVATLKTETSTKDQVFNNLEIQHNNAMLLVNKLRISEQQKQDCLAQLKTEAASGAEKFNCEHALQLLNQVKLDSNCTDQAQIIVNLQKELEVIKNDLTQQRNQCESQKTELLHLQEELVKVQNTRATSTVGSADISLTQDKDLAEAQIQFLNSIIVDIQKKNEEQRARIEILEAGYSPAMADDMKSFEPSGRQLPPRMYCDICEEFDLHETEECPQQNSEVVPSNGGAKHTDRPYCEICEAFGHSTEDCEEELTF